MKIGVMDIFQGGYTDIFSGSESNRKGMVADEKRVVHNRWSKSMKQRIEYFEKWAKEVLTEQTKSICNVIEI